MLLKWNVYASRQASKRACVFVMHLKEDYLFLPFFSRTFATSPLQWWTGQDSVLTEAEKEVVLLLFLMLYQLFMATFFMGKGRSGNKDGERDRGRSKVWVMKQNSLRPRRRPPPPRPPHLTFVKCGMWRVVSGLWCLVCICSFCLLFRVI